MNEMQAWEQRLGLLHRHVPGVLSGGKSVLYIGATPHRFQMGRELFESGARITLLEAHGPFADHYRGHPWLNDVIHGDARSLPAGRKWDYVIWWHGPEHIKRDELPVALCGLESAANELVLLGTPWGNNRSGMMAGNPYSVHASHLDKESMLELGYECDTIGVKDNPGTWCHMMAWKHLGQQDDDDLCVYTAEFGGYDTLSPVQFPDVPHYCFTDNVSNKQGLGWELIECKERFLDPRRDARMYKALSHIFLKKEITIWQDANMILLVHPNEVTEYLGINYVATFAHPDRDCIYQEAEAIIELAKADSESVNAQVAHYRNYGHPPHGGLYATGLLVRTKESAATCNEQWWAQICAFTARDQLSFANIFTYGDSPAVIPGNIYDNGIVRLERHGAC